MGKLLGFGKGQQGTTLRLNYKNFLAEMGVVNGKFVFYVNNDVVHNLGTMQDAINTNASDITALASIVTGVELNAAPLVVPTTDPGVAGQLWYDTDTFKLSTGE